MLKNDRSIRVTKTVLGTIWISCSQREIISLSPWWHGTCRLDGKELPYFAVTLQRIEGLWTVAKFNDSIDPEAPKWPRGARTKVPNVVLEIGTAWAATNESVIRERATEQLKWEVEHLVDGCGQLRWLRETIGHAEALDRVDLLEPLKPLIRAIVGEFSRINRRLSHRKAA